MKTTFQTEMNDDLRPEYDLRELLKGGVRGKYIEMDVEEEHLDILQNIEFAIMSVYRDNPLLVDFDVEAAINALISLYHAQAQNHEARRTNLNERATLVFERVGAMCDWRLGREGFVTADGSEDVPPPEPVTVDVILACLKRIRKSVQRWNKEGGRQGYLTFVGRFVR
jgi:hypothetical protein